MSAPQIVITLDPGASGRYTLTAIAEPYHDTVDQYDFTLRAMEIATGRTSVVNQVNFVLSWFDATDHEDWPWPAKWYRLARWLRALVELVKPPVTRSVPGVRSPLAELEAAFDEDRDEGEWGIAPEAKDRLGYEMCLSLEHRITAALIDAHTTWLTTSELLAQIEQEKVLPVPVQLGVNPIYLSHQNPVGTLVLVDEETGRRELSPKELLEKYPNTLGKVWRWVDPLVWTKLGTSQTAPSTNCPDCGDELYCNHCGRRA